MELFVLGGSLDGQNIIHLIGWFWCRINTSMVSFDGGSASKVDDVTA